MPPALDFLKSLGTYTYAESKAEEQAVDSGSARVSARRERR